MKGYVITSSKQAFYMCSFQEMKEEQIAKLCGQATFAMQNVFPTLCSYGREYLISGITPMEWDNTFSEPDDERFDAVYRKKCNCEFCNSFAKLAEKAEMIDDYVKQLLLDSLGKEETYVLLMIGDQVRCFNNKLWRYSTKN